MPATVTMEEAHAKLPELFAHLADGEELIITQDDKPVARLVRETSPRKPRKAGNCKGMMKIISDDDEHLKDFEEYMECDSCSTSTRLSGSC